MFSRFLTVCSLCAGLAMGSVTRADEPMPVEPVPAEKPVPKPAPINQPVPAQRSSPKPAKPPVPSTRPTDPRPQEKTRKAPATRPAKVEGQVEGFPSAREAAAKLLGQKKVQDDLLKIAMIDLDQPLGEAPPEFALFADNSLTLHSVLDRLHQAREDKNVRAVLLNLTDTTFNVSQANELAGALREFSKSGKRTFVYADAYDTPTYLAACGASDICMLEGGEIQLPGVGLETMFAKELLDKAKVKADYVQIGQYKGADEQYTRSTASPEMRGELNKIVDSLYANIVESISYHRNISKNDVKDAIDNVMISGTIAKQRHFVDHLIDQDGLRDLMKKEMNRDIDILHDYGVAPREAIDLSSPFALFSMLMKQPKGKNKHDSSIALIYAQGVIVDGEAQESLLGGSEQVGSENLRKAMRMAARDDSVEAIVLRIDSPGGSAMASEVMWQAVRRAAAEKPVIISVGSMAASGGYYLASAGDYIFADPTAIVGSIGVVGGKFVTKDLFDWAGLHTETFARGKNADLFSSSKPFSESQRRLVTNWMQQTYEQFTGRVMSQRKNKIKDIDEVAHGRIFLAKQAKSLGMVDELGGLERAIAYAAEKAELEPGEYDVKLIPGTRTLGDLLRGGGPEARMPFKTNVTAGAGDLSALLALPPSMRKLVAQQLVLMQVMEKRPVMLAMPYIITTK